MTNEARSMPPPAKATLPEDIGMYLDSLRQHFPAIGQVFVLGADAADRAVATWRLLAFGDQKVLAALRKNPELRRESIDLLIVTDGDRFESVFEATPPGSLVAIRWELVDPDTATYGDGEAEARAKRVR
jgi:hypothetical protein